MRHLRASTWIGAPPQHVWDLYADVEGSVAWVPFAEEILAVSGPAGLGQVYQERTRLGGISDVADSRVPGPLGWIHERLFGVVARRGIESALRAAKATLESRRDLGDGTDQAGGRASG